MGRESDAIRSKNTETSEALTKYLNRVKDFYARGFCFYCFEKPCFSAEKGKVNTIIICYNYSC